METHGRNGSSGQVVLIADPGGVTVVEPSTPLKRLNYFDGKFLRASDFEVEQTYQRRLVAISNQGLGSGVVYGYDTTLGRGDTIEIGPGLAIDPSGHVLLLQSGVTQSIQALIDASRKVVTRPPDASGKTGSGAFNDCVEIAAPPPTVVLAVSDIYVIAICTAEAFCGQQDVYGKLCEEACVTSTDRPYRLEGVVLRAIPLQLVTPFPVSRAVPIDSPRYLRSKVAQSWFEDEARKHPNAVFRSGLLSETWCLGAGYNSACCEVPLAVVARAGETTVFLDAWIVRRERMEAPARRYWQWKMRMRPLDVFLAQVLQFQCQLADLLSGHAAPGDRGANPLASHREALDEAVKFVDNVHSGIASFRRAPAAAPAAAAERPQILALSLAHNADLRGRLTGLLQSTLTPSRPKDQVLIQLGMTNLPPGGYLPLLTGTSISVNDQVRALLGDGLDLRFCVTTADYIAHALEEAQHMERISLVQGLDDPSNKPRVDILVPDGKPSGSVTPKGALFAASLRFSANKTGGLNYQGAAREETLESGGAALHTAMAGLSEGTIEKLQTMAKAAVAGRPGARPFDLRGDLATNTFVTRPKITGEMVDRMVVDAAAVARTFVNRAGALGAVREPAVSLPASVARGTVDGLSLTCRTDREIKSLAVKAQTPVHFRAILGTKPTSPLAFELTFHGTFSAATVSAPPAGTFVAGTINGTLSVGIMQEDQSLQKTIEYIMTKRVNWPARFTYTGDDANGSIVLDLTTPAGTLGPLQFVRTVSGNQAKVAYSVGIVPRAARGGPVAVTIGEIDLVADPHVVETGNVSHRAAEAGLDIVQAALIVSEPAFQQNARASLFPPLPPATLEMRIDAVRDWVMFTRRREKTCTADVVPVKPLPPRGYRVLNMTVSEAEAKKRIALLAPQLADPAKAEAVIKQLLVAEDRRRNHLVVRFNGGTATPLSDLSFAKNDWEHFDPPPGKQIAFAAIGAVGEIDAGLQFNRLHAFEAAIGAAGGTEVTIIPYPEKAMPADADGVMAFVTIEAPKVVVKRQHVFGANPDIFKLILDAVGRADVAQLATLLKRSTDLGLAEYSVEAGVLTVKDATVVSAFMGGLAGNGIRDSLVLSSKGAAAGDIAHQVETGKKVVSDLPRPLPPLPPTNQRTLTAAVPVPDAESILVMEMVPTIG